MTICVSPFSVMITVSMVIFSYIRQILSTVMEKSSSVYFVVLSDKIKLLSKTNPSNLRFNNDISAQLDVKQVLKQYIIIGGFTIFGSWGFPTCL